MKKINYFICLIAMVTSFVTSAETLKCESVEADDYAMIVYDSSAAVCLGSTQKYLILIDGLGIGLRDNTSYFNISCPFQKELDGTYVGVKSDISIGGGLMGGLYVGKGACVVGGVQTGLGAAISGSKLQIINYDRIYGVHGGFEIRDLE